MLSQGGISHNTKQTKTFEETVRRGNILMVLYSDRTFHFPRRPRPYCKVSPRHPSVRIVFPLKYFWSPQFLLDNISIWQPFFASTLFLTCFQIKLTPWHSCTWGLLSAPNVWKMELYLNIVIFITFFLIKKLRLIFFIFVSSTQPDRDWYIHSWF